MYTFVDTTEKTDDESEQAKHDELCKYLLHALTVVYCVTQGTSIPCRKYIDKMTKKHDFHTYVVSMKFAAEMSPNQGNRPNLKQIAPANPKI